MKPRLAVLAAILAIAISNPHPALSKGKKPEPADDEEYSKIQEEMIMRKAGEPKPNAEPEPAATPEPEAKSEPERETRQETYPPQESVRETAVSAPDGSVVHVVWIWQESKDCLWNLAKKHYKDPWQWKKIYLENRSSILNPGVIFPKQRIVIPQLTSASK